MVGLVVNVIGISPINGVSIILRKIAVERTNGKARNSMGGLSLSVTFSLKKNRETLVLSVVELIEVG